MVRYPKLISGLSTLLTLLLCLSLAAPGSELLPDAVITSTCVGCHEGMDALLAKTPHRILVSPEGRRVGNSPIGCGDCHPRWEEHLGEPGAVTIGNPEKMTIFENLKLCSTCHFYTRMQECREFNVHFRNEISCSNCHSIYHPQAEHLLRMPSTDLCLGCHQEKEAKFFSVSHHPLREGVIECVDCHRALREPGKAFSSVSPNEECYRCHSEYEGPHPFEHEAVNDYSIERKGCTFCHDPHGAPNPRLLMQPVGQLCVGCHFVPRHRTAHGGIWAERNCLECHVEVHGSYASKRFFGEDLFGGACFGRGCHSQ